MTDEELDPYRTEVDRLHARLAQRDHAITNLEGELVAHVENRCVPIEELFATQAYLAQRDQAIARVRLMVDQFLDMATGVDKSVRDTFADIEHALDGEAS